MGHAIASTSDHHALALHTLSRLPLLSRRYRRLRRWLICPFLLYHFSSPLCLLLLLLCLFLWLLSCRLYVFSWLIRLLLFLVFSPVSLFPHCSLPFPNTMSSEGLFFTVTTQREWFHVDPGFKNSHFITTFVKWNVLLVVLPRLLLSLLLSNTVNHTYSQLRLRLL